MNLVQALGFAHSPVFNYILPGLTSWMIASSDELTVRLFTMHRNTEGFVHPHSHRFGFSAMVLAGHVYNTLYTQHDQHSEARLYDQHKITPRDGGLGEYRFEQSEAVRLRSETTLFAVGETYCMEPQHIHSITFSNGAAVLMYEQRTSEICDSLIFTPPTVRPEALTQPWMFKRGQGGVLDYANRNRDFQEAFRVALTAVHRSKAANRVLR